MKFNALKLFVLCLFLSCKTTTPLRPTVSVNPQDIIKSPLKLNVNSMGVWYAHEGELGHVQLLNQDGKEIALGILTTSKDWMKSGPVQFETILVFDAKESEKGTLIIHNNPGDGDGDEAGVNHAFEIPIRFKP